MECVFLEVIVQVEAARTLGLESRDEIEGPLEDALSETESGEVTGGGGGSGVFVIDIEVSATEFEDAMRLIKSTLARLKVPPSTLIRRRGGDDQCYSVY